MGLVGWHRRAAYCSSKAGVVNLTRVLAVEWADERHPRQRGRPGLRGDAARGAHAGRSSRSARRSSRARRWDAWARRARWPTRCSTSPATRPRWVTGHTLGDRRRLDRMVSAAEGAGCSRSPTTSPARWPAAPSCAAATGACVVRAGDRVGRGAGREPWCSTPPRASAGRRTREPGARGAAGPGAACLGADAAALQARGQRPARPRRRRARRRRRRRSGVPVVVASAAPACGYHDRRRRAADRRRAGLTDRLRRPRRGPRRAAPRERARRPRAGARARRGPRRWPRRGVLASASAAARLRRLRRRDGRRSAARRVGARGAAGRRVVVAGSLRSRGHASRQAGRPAPARVLVVSGSTQPATPAQLAALGGEPSRGRGGRAGRSTARGTGAAADAQVARGARGRRGAPGVGVAAGRPRADRWRHRVRPRWTR